MDNAVQFNWTDGQYGLVRLNRADKHNAISLEMAHVLKDTLDEAKNLPIKCLVLTGAGKNTFCAGGDLDELHADLSVDDAFALLYPMKEVLYELAAFPVPTICILNGDAYGGGCELATACDFRIAKSNTSFGFIQSRIGIAPGWGGASLLYEAIHPNDAYQWLVKGCTYDALTLESKGWIHDIFPYHVQQQTYDEILQPYLSRSVEQMTWFKQQYKTKVSTLTLHTQMNEDVRACSKLWGNSIHKQALQVFHDK